MAAPVVRSVMSVKRKAFIARRVFRWGMGRARMGVMRRRRGLRRCMAAGWNFDSD